MAKKQETDGSATLKSRSGTLDGRSGTNSIESYDEVMNPLQGVHRTPWGQNSFGVPSINQSQLNDIIAEMQQVHPSKTANYSAIIANYADQVVAALVKGFFMAKNDQLEKDLIPVSFHSLRTKCGRYGTRKKQYYWFDWFQTNYPLMNVINAGYKFGKQGQLTMVTSNIDLEILIAGQQPQDIFDKFYGNLDPDTDIDLVKIDQRSLANYIAANSAIKKRNNVLDENLRSAKTILLISQAPQCHGQLPQIVSESSFGRRYYKGINLQSCSKIVRQAALGHCHQYDIEASVFTWKLDFVKSLFEIKLPATIDYLEFKNHHRRRIAQQVFDSSDLGWVDVIKRAITAVGFGAKATNSAWINENGTWSTTALRDIIKSPSNLNKFLNDPWVKEFMAEQEAMNKLIFEEIKDLPYIANDADLRNKNNQVSRGRAIAKAYQTTERRILAALTNLVSDKEVMLTCHDGFYTKQRCNLAELKEVLRQYMPTGQLDHEEFQSYKFTDLSIGLDHEEHMAQEERQARHWAESHGIEYQKGSGKLPKHFYRPPVEDYDAGYRDGSCSEEDINAIEHYEE